MRREGVTKATETKLVHATSYVISETQSAFIRGAAVHPVEDKDLRLPKYRVLEVGKCAGIPMRRTAVEIASWQG